MSSFSAENEMIKNFFKEDRIFNLWQKYCDLSGIYHSLVANDVLTIAEYADLCTCNNYIEANMKLWSIFLRNPSLHKLTALMDVLKEKAHNNNRKLDRAIEQFCKLTGSSMLLMYSYFTHNQFSSSIVTVSL